MKTKAAVLYEYNQPLVFEEIDLQAPRAGEVLVEMKAAGLCHSDIALMTGALPLPLPCIPGHEGAGVVREVGSGVTQIKVGDHVLSLWVPSCGKCFYCLRGQPYLCDLKMLSNAGVMKDGSCRLSDKGGKDIRKMCGVGTFSQFQVMDEEALLVIDPEIPFDVAAISGCAVVTGVGAALNTAKVAPGETVSITGVGGVGINIVQGAVLANAATIIAIDVLDEKLDLAKKYGATHVINASKEKVKRRVFEITEGRGVDYAFEALGRAESTQEAFGLTRRGGYLVVVGIAGPKVTLELPYHQIPLVDRSILSCHYGSSNTRVDLPAIHSAYRKGRLNLDDQITNRYTFDEIEQGFADLKSGKNLRGVVLY